MRKFTKPNIFVSACIEFDECRYDGSKISSPYVKRLKEIVNIIRVCPELAIGMSSPREALRLVDTNGDISLLSSNKGTDYTDKMIDFSKSYTDKLKDKNIDGFLMKAKSPTCGLDNVKVYYEFGKQSHVKSGKGNGIFTKHLKDTFTDIPFETERRISNYKIREKFFTDIYTLSDFRNVSTIKDLVEFHSDNKYLFMLYNQLVLKRMGNIVANHDRKKIDIVLSEYHKELTKLLNTEYTTKKRMNVLSHIYGYFKKDIQSLEKEYYFDLLDDFLNSKIPYSSLLSVLYGWAIRFQQDYLLRQTIFEPYPKQLLHVMDSGKSV